MMKFPTHPANAKQAPRRQIAPNEAPRPPQTYYAAKTTAAHPRRLRNISLQPAPCKSPGYFFFGLPPAFAFFTFGAGINTAVSSSNSRRRSASSSSSSATG